MQKFLQNCHLVHNVPGPIREALSEAGYSERLLDGLDRAYVWYRNYKYKGTSNETVQAASL